MFPFLKKEKSKTLYALANGKSVAIEDVPDEVFSQKMMGDGIAIIPDVGEIYAPCHAKVSMVMKNTKHAIGLECEDGLSLLIHVGLDTVELMGEGFETHVKVGDEVETGDLLITYDKEKINEKGLNDMTMLVIVEQNNHKIVKYHANEDMSVSQTPFLEYK